MKKQAGAPQPIRILVADDSAEFRSAVGQFLDRLPQVEVIGLAEDGEQALTLAARTQPDLVLMDLKMPGLNGLEATRLIRADLFRAHVIVITLHDSAELQAASLAAGADRFISKHPLRAELPGAIAQLFPGHAGRTGEVLS